MIKSKSMAKVTAAIVLCSVAGLASANGRGGNHGWPNGGDKPPSRPHAAPEIDPASAGSALTMLLGGLTVLRSRRAARGK